MRCIQRLDTQRSTGIFTEQNRKFLYKFECLFPVDVAGSLSRAGARGQSPAHQTVRNIRYITCCASKSIVEVGVVDRAAVIETCGGVEVTGLAVVLVQGGLGLGQ
jgi:hypothetical protein